MVGREGKLRDLRAVAEAAVGDDSRDAPLHQPREQDAARGGRRGVAAAVDHEDGAGRAFLDALALRVAAVLEDTEMIEILARRDVAQRVGRADHARARPGSRARSRDEQVAEAALEQNGRQGCRRDRLELFLCER